MPILSAHSSLPSLVFGIDIVALADDLCLLLADSEGYSRFSRHYQIVVRGAAEFTLVVLFN